MSNLFKISSNILKLNNSRLHYNLNMSVQKSNSSWTTKSYNVDSLMADSSLFYINISLLEDGKSKRTSISRLLLSQLSSTKWRPSFQRSQSYHLMEVRILPHFLVNNKRWKANFLFGKVRRFKMELSIAWLNVMVQSGIGEKTDIPLKTNLVECTVCISLVMVILHG